MGEQSDLEARSKNKSRRRRSRRRRFYKGLIKGLFWIMVMSGVFILGIGYGRIVGGSVDKKSGDVRLTVPQDPVTVTLPTKTVTVTKTVRESPKSPRKSPNSGRTKNE